MFGAGLFLAAIAAFAEILGRRERREAERGTRRYDVRRSSVGSIGAGDPAEAEQITRAA
jgi:hypothetical protein